MNFQTINQAANGKWAAIFKSLGIFVDGSGKHSPCPVCGGIDRFRFDNLDLRGTWICNQCGAGDGIDLIAKFYACNKWDALQKVAENIGLEGGATKIATGLNFSRLHQTDSSSTTLRASNEEDISVKVAKLLAKTTKRQSNYLTKKGLNFPLNVLKNGTIFAPIQNVKGDYVGAQFIESNGKKRLMKGTKKNGAFVKINADLSVENASQIMICEGIATGISLYLITDAPKSATRVIAAIDAGNLLSVSRKIREKYPNANIIIAGDNDAKNVQNIGRIKAMEAANKIDGFYSIPSTDFNGDWDDFRQQFGLDKAKKAFVKNLSKLNIQSQQVNKNSMIKGDLSKSENLRKPKINLENNLTKLNVYNEKSTGFHKKREAVNLSQMAASQRAEVLFNHFNQNLALDNAADSVFYFDKTVWKPMSDKELMREMVKLYDAQNAPYSQLGIKSTIDTLKLQIPFLGAPNRQYIGFKNGIFDLKTQQFFSHNAKFSLKFTNDIVYHTQMGNEDLETNAPNFYAWLSHSSSQNTDKMHAIKAALFMILANRYDWQLFLEITGAGGSGKSIFTEIATLLAGKNNTVSASMNALENARERAILVDKSFVILPDQVRYVGDGAGIKAITGGDDVAIDPKHKPPYSCKLPCVILAVNNQAMSFSDRSGGISRRRVIFHFSNIVPEHKRDLHLMSKIANELPIVIRHLLQLFENPNMAKKVLLAQKTSQEALEIKQNSDSLVAFCSYLNSLEMPEGMFMGNLKIIPQNPKRYLYHAYREYIESSGLSNPLSLTQFGISLNYAMNEQGKIYVKKRVTSGIRTNLELNLDKSLDWLPKADLPDKEND